MAFAPVTRGEAQGKAGAGSVCSNASRCVLKAVLLNPSLRFPSDGDRIRSEEGGSVSALNCSLVKTGAALTNAREVHNSLCTWY